MKRICRAIHSDHQNSQIKEAKIQRRIVYAICNHKFNDVFNVKIDGMLILTPFLTVNNSVRTAWYIYVYTGNRSKRISPRFVLLRSYTHTTGIDPIEFFGEWTGWSVKTKCSVIFCFFCLSIVANANGKHLFEKYGKMFSFEKLKDSISFKYDSTIIMMMNKGVIMCWIQWCSMFGGVFCCCYWFPFNRVFFHRKHNILNFECICLCYFDSTLLCIWIWILGYPLNMRCTLNKFM